MHRCAIAPHLPVTSPPNSMPTYLLFLFVPRINSSRPPLPADNRQQSNHALFEPHLNASRARADDGILETATT